MVNLRERAYNLKRRTHDEELRYMLNAVKQSKTFHQYGLEEQVMFEHDAITRILDDNWFYCDWPNDFVAQELVRLFPDRVEQVPVEWDQISDGEWGKIIRLNDSEFGITLVRIGDKYQACITHRFGGLRDIVVECELMESLDDALEWAETTGIEKAYVKGSESAAVRVYP